MSEAMARLIGEVREIVREGGTEEEITARVAERLKPALHAPDLLSPDQLLVKQGGFTLNQVHVEPDDSFISWSMAKSITNALVGILVRQGKLDISQPIPVKEWGDDDPRRRITIDQMLRMVDGLRFREAEHLGGGAVRYYPEDE